MGSKNMMCIWCIYGDGVDDDDDGDDGDGNDNILCKILEYWQMIGIDEKDWW